ncbi:hypothetical protein OSL75_10940, partial [Escherichia coli]|nr:hypothetical protein [Escherichia coli]
MPILDLRFSNKSIHQLPHPLTGCQEYRDIQCQNLRALVYPKRITLAFRATGNDSNLLIVFYVQIMPDDFVMQLHR